MSQLRKKRKAESVKVKINLSVKRLVSVRGIYAPLPASTSKRIFDELTNWMLIEARRVIKNIRSGPLAFGALAISSNALSGEYRTLNTS